MDNFRRPAVAKTLSILSFIIILFILYIVAQNPGVQGYEISIYDKYPLYFWYLIIFCISICQMTLFLNIFFRTNSCISWKAAYIGIVFSNSISLLIPLIRRYAIYGHGDPSTHMGYILDVLQTGHIGPNMYPIAHIHTVISSLIVGFDLHSLLISYNFGMYIFFTLCLFLLYKIILKDRSSILIGMMLAPLVLTGPGSSLFNPNSLANMYLPMLLYLYFIRFLGKNLVQYEILLVLALIFVTFIHPLACIFFIVVFLMTDIVAYTMKYFDIDIYFKNSSILILIGLIIFLMWQSYVHVFVASFLRINAWLFAEFSESPVERYSTLIQDLRPDFEILAYSIIYNYGIYLLIFILGAISIFILIKAQKSDRLVINRYNILFPMGFVFFGLAYFVSQFIVTGIGINRIINWALLFSLFLIPMAFVHLLKELKNIRFNTKFLVLFFVISLFLLNYLSVFTMHYSPIIRGPGQQVTDSQLIGMDTFFQNRAEELNIMEGGISLNRIKDALYGRSKLLNNVFYRTTSTIPPHFNYSNSTYFGDNYGIPLYLVISMTFRISYPTLFPEYPERWKFNQTDFNMLEKDLSVSKVYSNRVLDVYLLSPYSKKVFSNEKSVNNL